MTIPVFNHPVSEASVKQSTCPYCGVGCGVDVNVEHCKDSGPRLSGLKGTPEHPANFGRLCVKGSNLLETVANDGRLAQPMMGDMPVEWSEATSEVAKRFQQIIAEHGPDAVAFYVSGQLLTEDYYVANKLMKGYIGSANIDTNSRLCMSSAVAAYKRAFGADSVPSCYEDLEQSDLLVFVGSNAAWTHPVLFQRIERARQINPALKVVFIDPRRTASCEIADLHLPIKPGSDVELFNGLLNYLDQQNAVDKNYIEQSVEGYNAAREKASEWTLERVAEVCDVSVTDLCEFYRLFAEQPRVVTAYSMGVNQSVAGVDKANSIINCHLATGKLGKPGCGPFSLTGQPNAMGGREVGGLANMLAAHMELTNSAHRDLVQSYWGSPAIADKPGLKAVDLFEKIDVGEVKAVWVMATNPLVSLPNRNLVERALEKCEFVVVSDYVSDNDTLRYADVKFPATGWSEKDGTVTNSERRISRQRALLPPYSQARHDWKIVSDVAKAMGFDGFDFDHPSQIFDEYVGLTAYENNGQRDLDLSGLVGMTRQQYDALAPVQWPVNDRYPNGCKRMFADGEFYTKSGKAQCIALDVKEPEQLTSAIFPFVLNSGRLRDQWHTMTRTGVASQLSRHVEQSFVAMHPADASERQLKEGDLLVLNSALTDAQSQQVVLPLQFDEGLRRGELFAPIHWNLTNSSSAAVAYLYSNANDPISGQPELKHAAVSVEKAHFEQFGVITTSAAIPRNVLNELFDYWIATPVAGGATVRFALKSEQAELVQNIKSQLEIDEWLTSSAAIEAQLVGMNSGRLSVVAYIAQQPIAVERSWLEAMLGQDTLDVPEISGLLAGEPSEEFKRGRTVCSCFEVGEKTIVEAIEGGCNSVDGLGDKLKCGTNCGSCRSELSQIIKQHSPVQKLVIQKEAV